LADSSRFPAMAKAGHTLVMEHHTYPKLREYVIRETLQAHARSKN